MKKKGGWPPSNMNCPPGLEYLMPLDKVFIDQRIDPFEAAIGWEQKNRYTVLNVHGQPIYVLREASGWLMRACFGSNRRFKIKVFDYTGREAFEMKKPIQLIHDEIQVFNSGNLLGSIHRLICTCTPEFEVRDHNGITVLRISGPFCICGFNIEFTVYANNGSEIGMIKKQWSGTLREIFTNADVFGVNFPQDLDVKVKALLLAATILVDFVYFERN